MSSGYVELIRLPSARRLIYALSSATISYGMVQLTLLLVVHKATGSYPISGVAVGAFAVCAGLSAPPRGRLVDRKGAHPWLPVMSVLYTVALVALDIAASLTSVAWPLIALCGAVGAVMPPLFASARSVWPQAVPPDLVRRGYAVTSLLGDIGWVAGPALASALFLGPWWIAPLVSAVTCLIAATLSTPKRDPTRAAMRPEPMPRLRESRGLLALLLVGVAFGTGTGIVQVATPTIAGHTGHGSLGGPLLALFALGSVTGAVWFGSRDSEGSSFARFLQTSVILGVLIVPVCLTSSLPVLAVTLFVAGIAFGPATVSIFEALDHLAPRAGTEALTWMTTAEGCGAAGGASLAGYLVVHVGGWSAFTIASVLFVVPAGLAILMHAGTRRRRAALQN